MRAAKLVTDYLLAWILLAVAVGLAVPEVAAITRFSTPILAVMIGSISLTLSVAQFRAIRPRSLGLILVGHVAMPFVAFALARSLGLGPAVTAGFVVLGAVTPELVTPVMTELAGGETALSTTALVAIGVGSVAFVPAVVAALVGSGVAVDGTRIVVQLLVAVVIPMVVAVAARASQPAVVARYDDYYPAVSALMVVLIIGGVTAANAGVVRAGGLRLLAVGAAAVALNLVGYALGWVASTGQQRGDRIASTLSVGMRDFAVAAALVIAAGLPALASLPAVLFGVVEMLTSAGLARYFSAGE
jgi:BASS family bile acid:Na+ symporter